MNYLIERNRLIAKNFSRDVIPKKEFRFGIQTFSWQYKSQTKQTLLLCVHVSPSFMSQTVCKVYQSHKGVIKLQLCCVQSQSSTLPMPTINKVNKIKEGEQCFISIQKDYKQDFDDKNIILAADCY